MMKASHSIILFILTGWLNLISCSGSHDSATPASTSALTIDSTHYLKEPSAEEAGLILLDGRVCFFDDVDSIQKKINVPLDNASPRELDQIQLIMKYASLPQNFKIFRGENIDNAFATMVNNERLIVYNKRMFATIDALKNDYWASMFILAHEIGHHLAYNISDTGQPIQDELDADKFAAEILFKMGADSNQTLSAVKSRFISNNFDTKTHPSKQKRMDIVRQSWREASELRHNAAVPPPPNDQESNKNSFGHLELYNNINPDGGLEVMEALDADKSHEQYSENLSGIIVDVQKSEQSGVELSYDLKILVTDIDDEAKNLLKLKKGETYDIRVGYNQGPAMAARPDEVKKYFVGGRRMKFSAIQVNYIRAFYYYLYEAGHPAYFGYH